MDPSRLAADIAMMVILCVAAMFLHPIVHGPYSAVHGPTTALRAHYRALALLTGIALAACSVAAQLARSIVLLAIAARRVATCILDCDPPADPTPLRC